VYAQVGEVLPLACALPYAAKMHRHPRSSSILSPRRLLPLLILPLLTLPLLIALPQQAQGEIFAGSGDPVIVGTTKLLGGKPGWSLISRGGELVYQRNQPVWVLSTNLINAPATRESATARGARIKKHGRKVKPRIVYKMEPRWSAARVAQARRANAALGHRIAALGRKHRVERLLAAALRRKNSDPALGATPAQRARLAAYRTDRKRLEARRIKLPDYHTTSWSLTFVRRTGFSDAYHLVHPPAAAQECYRIDRLIKARLLSVEGAGAGGITRPGSTTPGTTIPGTRRNREVIAAVEAYRQALVRRDAAALSALVHPAYRDDVGTPSPHDDVDRKKLLATLGTLLRSVRSIAYTITYHKVRWVSGRAEVDAEISATYELKLPGGRTRQRRHTDRNRFKLQRHKGRWLLISGM
jgi:hypothetical protein